MELSNTETQRLVLNTSKCTYKGQKRYETYELTWTVRDITKMRYSISSTIFEVNSNPKLLLAISINNEHRNDYKGISITATENGCV